MRIASNRTWVEFAIGTEDFYFAEFKFKVLHEYGMVGVVLEEHDVV